MTNRDHAWVQIQLVEQNDGILSYLKLILEPRYCRYVTSHNFQLKIQIFLQIRKKLLNQRFIMSEYV